MRSARRAAPVHWTVVRGVRRPSAPSVRPEFLEINDRIPAAFSHGNSFESVACTSVGTDTDDATDGRGGVMNAGQPGIV